ncbi:MAG: helix-turn-helix domain-containing protein [Desulfobacterota bacterium]|nr:helix-turn-helix domain-containing protein [Thermodesulfobacteriota bacterium]
MSRAIYTIEQLSEKTGFPIRTIRYYIQEGLLEPPAGRGRGGFYYDSHLQRLMEIKAFQDRGLKLGAIQEMFKRGESPAPAPDREVWVRCPVVPGLEIQVSRDLEARQQKKIRDIIRIARSIFEEGEND